jgi:hypothetical protein
MTLFCCPIGHAAGTGPRFLARVLPEETRSALDSEGKHVTIQAPSPDLTSSVTVLTVQCLA